MLILVFVPVTKKGNHIEMIAEKVSEKVGIRIGYGLVKIKETKKQTVTGLRDVKM